MDREIPIPFGKKLSGFYVPPPSKSHIIRAFLTASLAEGESVIRSPSLCEDAYHLKEIIKKWRSVEEAGDSLVIKASKAPAPPPGKYFVGGSATTARFLLALFSLFEGEKTIDGDESLRKRAVGAGIGVARNLGARVTEAGGKGHFPVSIEGGKWNSKRIKVSNDISSQFISGLLIAAPLTGSETEIEIEGPASFPYIRMTMEVMKDFGVEAACAGNIFKVFPAEYMGRSVTIEKDYSGAAFLMAAAAVSGSEIKVMGLSGHSIQGDREIVALLEKSGVDVKREGSFIKLKGKPDKGLRIELTNNPDLFPPLAALALKCPEASSFRGIDRLETKESPRGAAIAEAINKIGGEARAEGGILRIIPERCYRGAALDPKNDHRLAMAFAVMGLTAEGTSVLNPDCVKKSYPSFWEDLFKLLI